MNSGDVAQLGERYVRNVQVVGSNPIISTNNSNQLRRRERVGVLLYLGLPPDFLQAQTGLEVARDLKAEDRLHTEVAILYEKHRGTVAQARIYGSMIYSPAVRQVVN